MFQSCDPMVVAKSVQTEMLPPSKVIQTSFAVVPATVRPHFATVPHTLIHKLKTTAASPLRLVLKTTWMEIVHLQNAHLEMLFSHTCFMVLGISPHCHSCHFLILMTLEPLKFAKTSIKCCITNWKNGNVHLYIFKELLGLPKLPILHFFHF